MHNRHHIQFLKKKKNEYTPHISENILVKYIYLRHNSIEIKLEYILE